LLQRQTSKAAPLALPPLPRLPQLLLLTRRRKRTTRLITINASTYLACTVDMLVRPLFACLIALVKQQAQHILTSFTAMSVSRKWLMTLLPFLLQQTVLASASSAPLQIPCTDSMHKSLCMHRSLQLASLSISR
jgi:hypothetical protein